MPFISDLDSSLPADTEGASQGASRMRAIVVAVKATFTGLTGAVTLTQAQLNDAARKSDANAFTNTNSFIDTNLTIIGSADATKKARLEVDGITTGTTRVITVPDIDLTLMPIATQAEVEAETASKAVPADKVKNSPGVAKAWVRFNVSGGAPSIVASYNVTSITDNGVGDFTVNFTTAFSSANYVGVITTAGSTSAASDNMFAAQLKGTAPTASAFRFGCYRSNVGDLNDPDRVFVIFYGDQ